MRSMPKGKFPINSTGKRDHLFNSVGIALYGTESVAPVLRLGSILAAINHTSHYIDSVRVLFSQRKCTNFNQ